jgi:hypothetical protein
LGKKPYTKKFKTRNSKLFKAAPHEPLAHSKSMKRILC